MKAKISIAEVLADLKGGKAANITLVRGTGTKSRGSLKVANVIHAFAYESFKKRTPMEHIIAREHKVSGKYAKRGLIPLMDTDRKEQLTVFISHIISYEGKKVMH